MKNGIIFLLIVVIFALIYFILSCHFCHCSDVQCPNTTVNKDYVI